MPESQHVSDINLSRAWARAFLSSMESGGQEITPLLVSVINLDGKSQLEIDQIRQVVDEALQEKGENQVHTVANTIFPQAFWNPAKDRYHLFETYLKNLAMIKRADTRNRNGLYFERMIAFGEDNVNQLEHVITTYLKGNHRRSALQAAIFDPLRDHSDSPQRGFPCLQQVAFTPSGIGKKQLTVTGFYATQHLFEKAYGNYLGLYRLGTFMAHEMGLELERVDCIAGVAKRGSQTKDSLTKLAERLRTILEDEQKHDETLREVA